MTVSKDGILKSKKLAEYFKMKDAIILISGKKRAIQTADFFLQPKIKLKELNEINSGICDSLSYGEISEKYPEIHKSRNKDKFNFRYPDGESYRDLILRVKSVIPIIESQKKMF